MILNAKKTFTLLFGIVLLSQIYVHSFKINIILQLIVLSFVLFFTKSTVSKPFIGITLPLFLMLFLGFLATTINGSGLVTIVKDFMHFIKPLVGVLLGYFIFKQVNDFRIFIKTIILAAFVCSMVHILKIIIFASPDESVNELRTNGLDNFLELFALFFIFYTPKLFQEPLFKKKTHLKAIKFLLILSCVLYFSRTMMVVYGIISLSIYGYTKLTAKGLRAIGIAILAMGLFYGYLYSIKIDRSGHGLEAFLYKIKNAPAELFKTRIDRENHADLWDHWRGYEAKRAYALMVGKPYSYVIGTGFGSLVNLKFKAPLGDSKDGMRYISELHNGYAYLIYKTGFLGLLLVLYFIKKLYQFVYKIPQNEQHAFQLKIISGIALVYVFTTLTITGIYNFGDTIIFILGGFIAFSEHNKPQISQI